MRWIRAVLSTALLTTVLACGSKYSIVPDRPTGAKFIAQSESFCETFRSSVTWSNHRLGVSKSDWPTLDGKVGPQPFAIDWSSLDVIDEARARVDLVLSSPVVPLLPMEACTEGADRPVLLPMDRALLLGELAESPPTPDSPLRLSLELQWPNCFSKPAPALFLSVGGDLQSIAFEDVLAPCEAPVRRFFLVPSSITTASFLHPVVSHPLETSPPGLPGSRLPRRDGRDDLMAEIEVRRRVAFVFHRSERRVVNALALGGLPLFDIATDVPHAVRVRFFRNAAFAEREAFEPSRWSDPITVVRRERPRAELWACDRSLSLKRWPWGARVPEGEPVPKASRSSGAGLLALDPSDVLPWFEALQEEGCLVRDNQPGHANEDRFVLTTEARIVVEGHGTYAPASPRIRISRGYVGRERVPVGIRLEGGIHPHPYPEGRGTELRLPPRLEREIVEGDDRRAHEQLIDGPFTPAETRIALAKKGYLRAVVGRWIDDEPFLQQLMGSLDSEHRIEMLTRVQPLPDALLDRAIGDPDPAVRRALVCTRRWPIPAHLVEKSLRMSELAECAEYRRDHAGRAFDERFLIPHSN